MNLAISENQSVWERGREVDGVTSSSKYKAKNNVHYLKKKNKTFNRKQYTYKAGWCNWMVWKE